MPPQSMTGYGRGSAGKFQIEIRSSNHKNFDVHLNLPHYLFSHDPEIRKIVRKTVNRGRIEIYVPKQEVDSVKLKINKSLATEYYNAFISLKEELSITGEIGIDLMASQRDIFLLDEPEIDADDLYAALDIALEDLKKRRNEEGEHLARDIAARIESIKKYLSKVEDARKEIVSEMRQKLLERLEEYLDSVTIDESRLIQETAFLVEKSDITEEIVRLKSHLKHFDEILTSGETVGKKMDFFVQELRREINTIGSKILHVDVATYVVEMKHELEKIKEQVQNLQ